MKLNSGQLSILRLAEKGAVASNDWWAPVSKVVWPLLSTIPDELLERVAHEEGGNGACRLTEAGKLILKYI